MQQNEKKKKPLVSIGMPVFNGEKYIIKALDSLLNQTFSNFKLIISDNASTDNTQIICEEYALKDNRIRYVRQPENRGALFNFKFVLNNSMGKYFMWAAHDDWRTPEFLEANVSALESNLKFVASMSPNCFDNEVNKQDKYVKFSLSGSLKERFSTFLKNSWKSHAIYYSLMRTETIKNYKDYNSLYAAHDWSLDFFLLSKGEINRAKTGLIVFGRFGDSMIKDPWKFYRKKKIEIFIPLYEFTKYALSLMKNLKYYEWLNVFFKLLKLNLQAMKTSYIITIKGLF